MEAKLFAVSEYSALVGPGGWSGQDLDPRTPGKGAVFRRRLVQEGDVVIAYEGVGSSSRVRVKRGAFFSCKQGSFEHDSMIGVPFGSRISCKQSNRPNKRRRNNGFVVVLPVSPRLWTNSLDHRTQVLYEADIAQILFELDICAGSIVIESGTGSGSLSTALAQALAPIGHLYTFEFNESRVKAAIDDFAANGLSALVTVTHRNVLQDGFKPLPKLADAVFLDLPSPWDAIDHADEVLRENGRICSFSPCIEQVQKTCDVLRTKQYSRVRTVEILLREFEARYLKDEALISCPEKISACTSPSARICIAPRRESRGHTGYLTFATKPLVSSCSTASSP